MRRSLQFDLSSHVVRSSTDGVVSWVTPHCGQLGVPPPATHASLSSFAARTPSWGGKSCETRVHILKKMILSNLFRSWINLSLQSPIAMQVMSLRAWSPVVSLLQKFHPSFQDIPTCSSSLTPNIPPTFATLIQKPMLYNPRPQSAPTRQYVETCLTQRTHMISNHFAPFFQGPPWHSVNPRRISPVVPSKKNTSIAHQSTNPQDFSNKATYTQTHTHTYTHANPSRTTEVPLSHQSY